jgi:hypothetical protein
MADLPQIDSAEVARHQPNAMVNDAGEVFYPDSDDDAHWFAEQHGARYLNQNPPDISAYHGAL